MSDKYWMTDDVWLTQWDSRSLPSIIKISWLTADDKLDGGEKCRWDD